MELADFSVNPKETTFRGARIIYNADAFTPAFMRKAAKAIRDGFVAAIQALPEDVDAEGAEKDEPDLSFKAKAVKGLEHTAQSYEDKARDLEIERDVYAVMLSGTEDHPVVMEWDLTRNGIPVEISEEEFKKFKPQIVRDLWHQLLIAADPKEQEIPPTQTSPTISEPTKSRSSSPATPPATDQVM